MIFAVCPWTEVTTAILTLVLYYEWVQSHVTKPRGPFLVLLNARDHFIIHSLHHSRLVCFDCTLLVMVFVEEVAYLGCSFTCCILVCDHRWIYIACLLITAYGRFLKLETIDCLRNGKLRTCCLLLCIWLWFWVVDMMCLCRLPNLFYSWWSLLFLLRRTSWNRLCSVCFVWFIFSLFVNASLIRWDMLRRCIAHTFNRTIRFHGWSTLQLVATILECYMNCITFKVVLWKSWACLLEYDVNHWFVL